MTEFRRGVVYMVTYVLKEESTPAHVGEDFSTTHSVFFTTYFELFRLIISFYHVTPRGLCRELITLLCFLI